MRRIAQHRRLRLRDYRGVLAGVVALTLGVGSLIALAPAAAPIASANTPGVPTAPTVVYKEDFSGVPNGGSTMINAYVSPSPTYPLGTYSAAAEYQTRTYCNGLIMTGNTQNTAGYTTNTVCTQLSRAMTQAMGLYRGETMAVARTNAALTDVTASGAPTPANGVVLETATPISLSTGRFLAVKLLAAAANCSGFPDQPKYVGYLVDALGNEMQINSTPINPCTDPAAVTITQPEAGSMTIPVKVLNVASDQSILVTTTSAKFRIRNAAVGGNGNDAATDDIELIDVSPTLDKQFSPANIGRGKVGTMVFTVTNTSELASKNGFAFTETLPGGLTIAPTPNFSTTCNNGAGNLGVITSGGTAGATSVGLKGSLATDQVSCTFKIDVLAGMSEGTITNTQANVNPSAGVRSGDTLINGASVNVRDPRIQVTKALSGVRVHAGDQFTAEIRQGAANGPVVNSTANATSAGSGATVDAGTGTTGTYQADAGSTYYVGESASGTTLLGQYTQTISCTDSAGLQPGLPTSQAFSGAYPLTLVAGSNVSCTLTNNPQAPGLLFKKRVASNNDVDGSGNVTVGDQIAYAFDLTNTGATTLSAIAVSDPTLGTVTCPQPSLVAGASETCTAPVRTVTQADIDAGSLSNTATATATDPAGETLTKTDSVTVASPGVATVSLSKTEASVTDVNGNSLRDAGDLVNWSFVVKNTGSVTLTNPTVTDSIAGVTVTCPAGSVAPNATVTCTQNAGYALTQADVNAGGVTNSATASARDPQNAAVTSPTATVTSSADQSYALSVTKSEQQYTDVNTNGAVDTGDTIQWQFAVQNTGTVPVSNLTINDPLLASRSVTVTCAQTTLAPGASTTCSQSAPFAIQQSDMDLNGASIQNQATARGTRLDGTTVVESAPSGTSRVLTAQASISMVKSATAPADNNGNGITDVGDTVTYSFAVTNNGTVTLSNPVVTDQMLANANPPITISCPASIAPAQTVTCTASAAYAITQADVDASGGALTNSATVEAATPNGHVPASVTSTGAGTSTSLSQATAISLTKSAAVTDVNGNGLNDAGDRVDYSFVVTNTGVRTLTNVALDDQMLAAAGSAITCGASTLASNASTTCTASYTITANDMNTRPGSLDNTATASGFSPSGTKVTSPSATARVQLDQVQGLQVSASTNVVDTDGDGRTEAGDQVQYTFTLTNSGSQTMNGVTLTSPQFTGHGVTVTCTPTSLAPGQVATCTATLTITQADVQNPAGLVVPVSAQGTPPGGSTFTGPSNDVVTPLTQTASMTLEKTASLADTNNSGRTDAGDQITYSFKVTSTGTEDIANLQLNDPMLTGISCPATLPAGGSVVCTAAPYTVVQADVQNGSVNNTATVTGTDINNATVTATDSATVVTPGTSGINLVKRVAATRDVNGSGTRDAGDGVTFAFDVTNSGTLTLTNPGITDAFLTNAGITATCPASIAPGATVTCTAGEYLMTQADVDAGGVTNTATAHAESASGSVTSSPSTVVAAADRVAALALSKTAVLTDTNSSGAGDVGETITWSFSVHNGGTIAVSNVTVNDPLLASHSLTVVCPPTSVAPGGDLTCSSVAYVIQQSDVDAGATIVNQATASATATGGGTVTSPPDGTSTPLGQAASLNLQKNVVAVADVNGNGVTDAGDTINWSFTVTNNGNLTASNITVNDPFVTAAGISISCPQASLGQNASETCTLSQPYAITQDDVDHGDGTVSNVATVSGTSSAQSSVTSPSSGTDTIVVQSAALSIVKTSSVTDVNQNGYTDAGDTIVYHFEVSNTGTQTVSSIAVDDPMLDGAGVTITCPSATLAPGAAETCTSSAYTVTQATVDASGTVENSATGTGRSPSGASVDSQAGAHSVALARIGSSTITKSATLNDLNANGKTDAGDTVSYTFAVLNTGSVTLANVTVVDPMLQARGIAISCDTTTLAPGATATCSAATGYVITQAMMDGSEAALTNTASATATDPDGATVTTGSASSASTSFTQEGALTLTKHAVVHDLNGNSRTDAGDTVTYTFDVVNSGTLTIDTISVSDPMLNGQSIAVSCVATTLAPEATTTCSATSDYRITQGTIDAADPQLTNAASASGLDQQDRTVTSTEATETIDLTQLTALSLVKTESSADTNGNGKRDAGDSVTYSFTVTNTGTQTIDDLEIDDPLLTAASVTPVCPSDTLVAGDTVTCTAMYTITQADVDVNNDSLANTATAAGAAPSGGPVVSAASTAHTAVTHESSMTVDVESHLTDRDGDGKPGPGDDLSWTITVTNTGTTTLGDVQFQSDLMRERGLTVTCNPASVAPGEQMVCIVSPLRLTNADAGKQITLDLTASAQGGDVTGRISDNVSAVPIQIGGPILAATGFALLPWMTVALALLAIGFALLAVQSRRRQQQSAA
ncbi:MAG TPA: hypothetical protein VFU07_07365 [Candidatus Lumbricidophila sp.]|nr:hypothetical protein [Candidatus Lumbricidophila sp.]